MESYPLATTEEVARLSTDELIEQAWRAGELRWLLQPHQQALYDEYRRWELLDSAQAEGRYGRIYMLNISKRWGKTTSRLVVRIEDCLRHPGRHYRYTTAFDKDIGEIVGDIMPRLLDTCPADLKPRFQQSRVTKEGPQAAGFYFPNGSSLRLAGLDKHPDALRGRASDGDDISEAAFIRHLKYVVKNVLYHQYQRRSHARMCLESSAPKEPDTEYDTEFTADARLRGAVYDATIDDNTALSDSEREEFIRASGGREHPDCKREYFNIRVRPEDTTVLPEFDKLKHVVPRRPSPSYAHCYVGADPAIQDMFALGWGYWDAARQKLVIQRSWAKRNAGTKEVADVLRRTEAELWGATLYYEREERLEKPNPFMRVSDIDARLLYDLANEYGIHFAPSRKDDADAQIYALRNAFANDLIEIEEGGGPLAEHCEAARWNDKRTDFLRTDAHGHFDCVDMLIYLWRLVSGLRNLNPQPPESRGSNYFEPPRKHEPTVAEALMPSWRRKR
jgi:hypothetical protein